jgi:hypothetical protein
MAAAIGQTRFPVPKRLASNTFSVGLFALVQKHLRVLNELFDRSGKVLDVIHGGES